MQSFAALRTLVMVILVGALARSQGQDVEAIRSDRVGLPWDWSHQHVVFAKTTDPEVLERIRQDPARFISG